MQILMCAGFYDVGGFATVMEQLANRLVEKGHAVTIGALWFRRFPPKGAYDVAKIPVSNPLKLRRFLEKFDIIHSHHAITNYLALMCRKPFVYHHHGAPNFGKGYIFRLNMISSIKLMKRAFDAVIAVSESGVAELDHYLGLDNVHLVYNGVNAQLFRLELKEKFRKGKPQFLFVGNLYEHKKVEELLFAMKELIKIYPKAYLQIIGHGQMYGVLERLVNQLKLEDHVELAGRVSGDDLPYHYASCDAYVTASRYEVCPVPLLEAMACGKPVVASSIPPHVELLTMSKAGKIYTIGNVESLCKKMTKTYEEGERYRDCAIHFAKEHSWVSIASKVLRVYTQVTA
jgi:glycosyltransferase involved in cell wall biosynthesis